MGSIAFELRQEYAGTTEVHPAEGETETVDRYTGGVVAVPPDGESFDVKAALEDGGGQILVDEANVQLVDTLRTLVALKETGTEDEPGITRYEELTSAQLKDELERRDLDTSGNKDERRERLEAADAAIAEGEDPAEATSDDSGDAGEEG